MSRPPIVTHQEVEAFAYKINGKDQECRKNVGLADCRRRHQFVTWYACTACGKTLVLGGAALPALREPPSNESGLSPRGSKDASIRNLFRHAAHRSKLCLALVAGFARFFAKPNLSVTREKRPEARSQKPEACLS